MSSAQAVPADPQVQTFTETVAEELRVQLARRRMTGRELARQLGVSGQWISQRTRGQVALSTDDIERIAVVLGLTPQQFMSALLGDGRPVTHVCSAEEQGSVIPFPLDRVAFSGRPDGGNDGAHVGTTVPPKVAGRVGEHDTAA